MSLREEVEQMMRWEASENPTVQRAFSSDPTEIIWLNEEDQFMLLLAITKSLRVAILRVAEEVDTMNLDSV